jgi:hypothetical protein
LDSKNSNISFINSNPISSSVISDTFHISLPEKLREANWVSYFGTIQRTLEKLLSKKAIQSFHFNFKNCRWADPIPVMSILMEIAKHSNPNVENHTQAKISISAPLGHSAVGTNPYQRSPDRLYSFLANEGFLDCIIQLIRNGNIIDLTIGDNNYDNNHLPERGKFEASYENSLFMPMYLVDLSTCDDLMLTNIMLPILNYASINIASKINFTDKNRLLYIISIILHELLQNSKQHAYNTDEMIKLCVIYARYRIGGENDIIKAATKERAKFLSSLAEENKLCPRLYASDLISVNDCIELFIADRGCGLAHNYKKKFPSDKNKHILRNIFNNAFLDGIRASSNEGKSKYGGLNLLHSLLQEKGDFIQLVEKKTWIGCKTPIQRHASKIQESFNDYSEKVDSITDKGVAFLIRLNTGAPTDTKEEKWLKFSDNDIDIKNDLFSELNLSFDECKDDCKWFEQQITIDCRFTQLLVSHDIEQEIASLRVYPGAVLWRVKSGYSKSDIFSCLETISKITKDRVSLVIADVPSYEAQTYVLALENLPVQKSHIWVSKFENVIFVTEQLRFAALKTIKKKQKYGFSTLHTDNITVRFRENLPARKAIFRWLKWHDSKIFWEAVANFDTNAYKCEQGEAKESAPFIYLAQTVSWGTLHSPHNSPRIINGYLNFAQALCEQRCAFVARSALFRIWASLSRDYSFVPLENLTKSILTGLSRHEDIFSPIANKIAIGSVLLTGTTQNDIKDTYNDCINFFVHPDSCVDDDNTQNNSRINKDSNKNKPSILFWMPQTKVDYTKAPRYKRIGKTAYIAQGGWKSYEIPRYDINGNQVGFCSPKDTYNAWQRSWPTILKAGHWDYEGHHDFLTVNLQLAIEIAFREKGALVKFLMQTIFPVLGIEKSDVVSDWKDFASDIFDEMINENNCKKQHVPGFLIYRSHQTSQFAINALLDTILPQKRLALLNFIYAILPVKRNFNSSAFLIPPIIKNRLHQSLKTFQNAKVLIFDDAAITGRTLFDLRALVQSLGVVNPHLSVILNRLRQNVDDNFNDSFSYFWRLDVPTLGKEGSCPFCHSVEMLKEFSQQLDKEYCSLLTKWLLSWQAVSPSENWNLGIPSLPLAKIESKKFAFRYPDGFLAEDIQISHSTGRVIHATEIHSMTGRDDYFLKKINEYFLNPNIDEKELGICVELAVCQILLFSTEISFAIYKKLIAVLIKALVYLPDNSAHSVLAAIIIISQIKSEKLNNRSLKSIINESGIKNIPFAYFYEFIAKHSDYDVPHNSYLYPKIAITLVLASLRSRDCFERSTFLYNLGNEALHLKQTPLTKRLNQLFMTCYSKDGVAHSVPFQRLLYGLETGNINIQSDLYVTYLNVRYAQKIIQSFDLHEIRELYIYIETILDEINTIFSGCICSLRSLIICLTNNSYPHDINVQDIVSFLHKIKDKIATIASSYFIIVDNKEWLDNFIGEGSSFHSVVSQIVEKYQANGKIMFSSVCISIDRTDFEARVFWIPFGIKLRDIIDGIISNVRHTEEEIDDPFKVNSYQKAKMWIKFSFENENFKISFANLATNLTQSKDTLKDKLNKRPERLSHLFELGGSFDVADLNITNYTKNILIITIQIPYAGYLRGNNNEL